MTIATTSTTPAGAYQITVVFTETTLSAAAGFVLLPILLFPLAMIRKKLPVGANLVMACLGFALLVGTVSVAAAEAVVDPPQ